MGWMKHYWILDSYLIQYKHQTRLANQKNHVAKEVDHV